VTLPEFKKLDSAKADQSSHVGVTLRARRRSLDLTLDQSEEMGYVFEGVVELSVGNQRWRLEPGDSFHFRSDLPHGYRNIGSTLARILWVNTPPTF